MDLIQKKGAEELYRFDFPAKCLKNLLIAITTE